MSRFLVDEDVNQKAVKAIPADQKGCDILFPEAGTFKGSTDIVFRKLAAAQDRVLVTGDRDFSQYNLVPSQVPSGVLWLRPRRAGQKAIGELLSSFCKFLLDTFPNNPYDFRSKIIEIRETEITIYDHGGAVRYPLT